MSTCKYESVDEFGIIRQFNSDEEIVQYLASKKTKGNESDLQKKFNELNEDKDKKEELNSVLKKIGEIFDNIKNNAKEILELSKKNPNLSAAIKNIVNMDRELMREKLNQAAFVFKTIQEYAIVGKHLEDKVAEIKKAHTNGEKSREDAYMEMKEIEKYYFGIATISFSLEDYVRGFLVSSEEPIFLEFKKVQNVHDSMRRAYFFRV